MNATLVDSQGSQSNPREASQTGLVAWSQQATNKDTNMKKQRSLIAAYLAAAMLIVSGCGAIDSTETVETTVGSSETQTDTSTADSLAIAVSTDLNAETHDNADHYLYDEAEVIEISLGSAISADSNAVSIDGTTATITEAGAYRISGTLDDGQILVDADDGALVQLILTGCRRPVPTDCWPKAATTQSPTVRFMYSPKARTSQTPPCTASRISPSLAPGR